MPDPINKKLDYLEREEVRTMEKDIAQLRERESETAREKISQIKTEEEAEKEAERMEQSKKIAEEREKMESEAQKKEEELTKLREEAALRESRLKLEEVERAEKEKESIRAQLKETQLREEERRRKFLEDIAAKSGKPIPEPPQIPEKPLPPPPPRLAEPSEPVPPPIPETQPKPLIPPPAAQVPPQKTKKPFKFSLPSFKIPKPKFPLLQSPKIRLPKIQLPKIQLPKLNGYFPQRPTILEKIWIRIIISLFVLAILATVLTFWYWYLVIRTKTPLPQVTAPIAPQETVPEKPKITQEFLGAGYYLPSAPRIIDALIIHSGYNTSNGDPYDLAGIAQEYKKASVATHYLIGRDGAIYQLAPDYAVAYHAGVGRMPDGRGGVNNFSVGISLVYREAETPNDAQYQSLNWLVADLQEKYNIPNENILGYKDISPEKTTPWNFDWGKLKLLFSFLSAGPDNGAEFILEKLTLEEKIGQLLVIGFEGTALTPQLDNFIKTVRPGGILLLKKNIESPSQIKKLIQGLQQISLDQSGLPLFVAIDQEGGLISRISFIEEKTGQPEIGDIQKAYDVGLKRGSELKKLGVNLNLAPVLDLTRTGDFLYERSFRKKPEEIGDLARALISGQKTAGILTAIKHFPGYGGITFNPEEKLTTLNNIPKTLQFLEAMMANPEFVMTASVIYPKIDAELPITFSEKGIAFLREKLGEDPLIITDDLSQKALLNNFSVKETVILPIKAGVDILLFSNWQEGIKDAAKDLPEELISKTALRIIRLKQDLLNP